ncbi:MAG: hypothetical protein ACI845_000594 [Gammaproteobacteria bacterium]|jgi:uncharacterized protein YneR
MCWLTDDISENDWMVRLSADALKEIDRLASFIEQNPQQHYQRQLSEVKLQHCHQAMMEMKLRLDDGVGFTVLDRLPVDRYPLETLVEIYWLLGQVIGRPVAQKWNGQMIYDVRDTGKAFAYGVRGSHTSTELLFHTDNAFARMVPDYVGLFCRHPAKSGGISRFCSLYSLHQRLYDQYPEALTRLYQPFLFDRQKEHAEGAEKTCFAPFFSWKNNRLFARANTSLIRKGYGIAKEEPDESVISALDAVDEICQSDDLWYEAGLEQGQIQYLNNHEIGHYRSAFEDHEDPDKIRHLFRLWHRAEGSSSYDGLYPI